MSERTHRWLVTEVNTMYPRGTNKTMTPAYSVGGDFVQMGCHTVHICMLRGGQEHRGTMANVQLLLLTVVLTLTSVEQLSYRNLQYAPTMDEVRMLGRVDV